MTPGAEVLNGIRALETLIGNRVIYNGDEWTVAAVGHLPRPNMLRLWRDDAGTSRWHEVLIEEVQWP